MSRYMVARYWSIAHACKVSRVSLTDERGREHVEIVPQRELLKRGVGENGRPRTYRDNLDAVLDRIQERIDGCAGED